MPKRAANLRVPQVDKNLPKPLYRSLLKVLRASINAGDLPPGARLPSTRVLAAALGVSRNTAARAYEELWADGLLAGRVGAGTYVTVAAARNADLRDRLRRAGFPIERVPFRDPDGQAVYLASTTPPAA
ncbi:MAG: GntR family transcriptional regulator [Bryobacteraceae bacterium]